MVIRRKVGEWKNSLYMVPALVILLAFWIVPMILVIIFSLFSWTYGTDPQWAGLSQYHIVLSDPLFWQSIRVTLEFVAAVVVGGTLLSLVVAVLLYRGIRAVGFFRSMYFLPYVLPVVATSTIWLWIYQLKFLRRKWPVFGVTSREGGPKIRSTGGQLGHL